MSSVDNILGLVSHLHSMESSFSAILIEAAMKLASLTDANLFILVETKDGRRFAGKRHLCNLYTSGELAPMGSDLEMEVDPSVIGLRARYVGGQSSQPSQHSDSASSSLPPTSSSSSSSSSSAPISPDPGVPQSSSSTTSSSSTNRPPPLPPLVPLPPHSSCSSSSVGSSPPSRAGFKRGAECPADDDRGKRPALNPDEAMHHDPIKREAYEPRSRSTSAAAESPRGAAHEETSSPSPRNNGDQNLPAMVSSGSQTELLVDQSYIEPFAGHFLESEDEFKTMLQNQSGSQFEGSALRLPLSCGMECGSSSDEIDDDQQQQQHQQQPHQIHLQQQQHSQPHQQSAHPHQFDSGGEEDERKPAKPYDHVMGWNTTEFLSQSIRANNVLGISDSSIADKTSANHRMFMSLIHEYTKESVKYVPEEKLARKEFVDKIFFNFWLYFPHLDTLHNLGAKISIGKRFYFLKAFVRAGIARGLSSILGRRSSYSQETLDNIDKKLTEMRQLAPM